MDALEHHLSLSWDEALPVIWHHVQCRVPGPKLEGSGEEMQLLLYLSGAPIPWTLKLMRDGGGLTMMLHLRKNTPHKEWAVVRNRCENLDFDIHHCRFRMLHVVVGGLEDISSFS